MPSGEERFVKGIAKSFGRYAVRPQRHRGKSHANVVSLALHGCAVTIAPSATLGTERGHQRGEPAIPPPTTTTSGSSICSLTAPPWHSILPSNLRHKRLPLPGISQSPRENESTHSGVSGEHWRNRRRSRSTAPYPCHPGRRGHGSGACVGPALDEAPDASGRASGGHYSSHRARIVPQPSNAIRAGGQ